MKVPTEPEEHHAEGRNLRNHSIYWGGGGGRQASIKRQRETAVGCGQKRGS